MCDEDQLSAAERELATALRSLRPTPVRIDAVAAARAAGRRTAPGGLPLRKIAAVAAAIAVVGGAWLALGPRRQMPDGVERHAPLIEADLGVANELTVEPPTLLAYRRALGQSPAELETLLDRQATTGGTPDNQLATAGMLTLWNIDLHLSLGEM